MSVIQGLAVILNHPFNRQAKSKALVRLLWWKINQWFIKLPAVVDLAGVVKLMAYPDSSSGSLMVYVNLPEYDEMQLVLALLGSQDVFIDVGANLGDYSLLAATKIKKGKIFAFEPLPLPLARFRENIQLNNFGHKIEVFNKVVSSQPGKIGFELKGTSEESAISTQGSSQEQITYFSATTLDIFLQEQTLKAVQLVKIDVEGAELEVLKGAQEAVSAGRLKIIILEVNSKCTAYGYTQVDTMDWLQRHHYKLCVFNQRHELVAFKPTDFTGETINLVAIHHSVDWKKISQQYRQHLKQS